MHPDPELLAAARRVVWFKDPLQTLRNEVFFLNRVMTYGDVQDVVTIRKHFDDDALRDSFRNAHPGVFDPRSWAYWHAVLGVSPALAMPVRRLQLSGEIAFKAMPRPMVRFHASIHGPLKEYAMREAEPFYPVGNRNQVPLPRPPGHRPLAPSDYPESDGKPMSETPVHRRATTDATQPLDGFFETRSNVYVGSDMFVY